ncbi:MIP/aquaporin family protein [Granulicella sp. L46]|uniref:MIP/aquaporin family protein n=1 Tax=Granulicella sp. L46 TaxID=1641865 RepID=UPI00131BCA83|nr:aquaporin [Granulicella sp. L46]
MQSAGADAVGVSAGPMEALRRHWFLYVYEGAELAWFMVAACVATVVLFGAGSPVLHWVPNAALRRLVMGAAMGGTAVLIIHSPMGKRSGAHFNPAITLTYLWLGKIGVWDAVGYVCGQFAGGVAGVGVAALMMGRLLAQPSVNYAVTVPGIGGTAGAFGAELFMAALLMGIVLWMTNRRRLAAYTSYAVGVLITGYVFFFAPVSGFSINPARTVGPAVFAQMWTAEWVYFVAPLLGMFGAAALYVSRFGIEGVLCAKLHAAPSVLCPYRCGVAEHVPDRDTAS